MGIIAGLANLIFFGGHIFPVSKFGDKELFRYIQKSEINNKISDEMNNINLIFKRLMFFFECFPFIFSFFTFKDHIIIILDEINIEILNIFKLKILILLGIDIKEAFIRMEDTIGIFLISTRWNLLFFIKNFFKYPLYKGR